MLLANFMPFGPVIGGHNWLFQQDNASIHCSKSTKEWLRVNGIKFMVWPSRSHCLNPIEKLWASWPEVFIRTGANFHQLKS